MILAAGRGERMRPLTDRLPKPLLRVGGRPLIEYLVTSLARAGIAELVVNHAHLGGMIEEFLGDGSHWGVRIAYSREGGRALETAGGICNALHLLGSLPFIVVNAGIWTDYDFAGLAIAGDALAHLVLVDNPAHHPEGDFLLRRGRVYDVSGASSRLTFSGIGVYRPALFAGCRPEPAALAPLLRSAMGTGRVSGERHGGCWVDVGTPERLRQLDILLSGRG